MRHGDYGVRIPKFSRRQTVAKASSILVDQVEQRGYRRKIKAKLNGVGRDARQLRQAWRYSEAPTESNAVKSVSALCDLFGFVAFVSSVVWKGQSLVRPRARLTPTEEALCYCRGTSTSRR
jgi:hypothetical protein